MGKTRETRETTTKSGIIFLCGLCGLFTQFLVKSREMWCQMKEPRMGHTKMYFPFGALSLVPQIAAFHKKLLEVHLVNESLSLRLVASEVLVKLHWVLVATLLKYLVAELACYLLAEDTLLLEV